MNNLHLAKRKINTRPAAVEIFDIDNIQNHFNEATQFIKNQLNIADTLIQDGLLDEAKDIWRSQIVFIDSAFDFFLHELLKLGIINIFREEWDTKTEKYLNLELQIRVLEQAIENPDNDDWLKQWINDKYSSLTMMNFSAFKDICNLLDLPIKGIADKAFYDINSNIPTQEQLKEKINSLFYRRNVIAHQSDRIRENAQRNDISKNFVLEKLDDIQKIINAVCSIVKLK